MLTCSQRPCLKVWVQARRLRVIYSIQLLLSTGPDCMWKSATWTFNIIYALNFNSDIANLSRTVSDRNVITVFPNLGNMGLWHLSDRRSSSNYRLVARYCIAASRYIVQIQVSCCDYIYYICIQRCLIMKARLPDVFWTRLLNCV